MKVGLKLGSEREGLLKMKEIHTVHVTVQMTEEEKSAAKAAKILGQKLFIIPWDTRTTRGPRTTVKDLTTGLDQTGKFPDFLKATSFIAETKDILAKVKNALEVKMGAVEEEFEL